MSGAIEINSAILGGKPIVKGTRFTVAQLLATLAEGHNISIIAEDFDLNRNHLDEVLQELSIDIEKMAKLKVENAEWARHGKELLNYCQHAVGQHTHSKNPHYADVSCVVSEVVDTLKAEIEQLKDQWKDLEESHRIVMKEKCPTDEIHCTCVPILRAEIKRLREKV